MEQTVIGVLLILLGGIVILFTELINRLGWIRFPIEITPGARRAGGIVAGSLIALYGLLAALHVFTMK